MKTFTKMLSSRVSDGTVVHLSSKALSLYSSIDTEKFPSSVFRVIGLQRKWVYYNRPNVENKSFSSWRKVRKKRKHLPDVHSDHVFSVGLLDHVVDGVAARKCYVDVVSCDNIWVVVVYGVYEHDVCVIWGLWREHSMCDGQWGEM